MQYSVNWQKSEGHFLKEYGALYKTLGRAKNKARAIVDDLNVKRCTVFNIKENKTVFDALAEKYKMVDMYKVGIGYTQTGREKWRKFDNFDDAQSFCSEVHQKTGIILTIIKG
jgi:hypothetical protein